MPRRHRTDMELALNSPARLRAVPEAGKTAEPSAEESDSDLLVRVAERDRIAFDMLYHRYVRSIFGLALRRLRDRQRAEDAVQETFAAVWRSAASYRPERGAAAAWLYAVARNAVVDRMRARVEPPAEAPDTASPEPGPPDRAEAGPTLAMTLVRPRLRVHRRTLLLAAAIVVLLLAFVGGYVVGNGSGTSEGHTLRLQGTSLAPAALASLHIEPVDTAGNWPMRISVTGLPKLPPRGYYEVYLVRDGRLFAPCGGF